MANATIAAPALRRPSPATGVLIGLLIAAAALLMYAGRHLSFFADEWVWILDRRGGGLNSFLEPYNGHFSLFPMAVYKLLFSLVGVRHYTAYRGVGVGVQLLCAVLLYILVRRRVGPWLALVPTTLLLFMGTAAQDLLWPFQIGFLGSIVGGLAALAVIEDRRSGMLATVLLVFSIASSGVGLAFLVAALVAIVARRDPWSRLWIVAVPSLVFLTWYAGWGQSKPITVTAVLGVPASIADAAAGVASAMAGLNTAIGPTVLNPWGPAVALVGLLVIARVLARKRRPPADADASRRGRGSPDVLGAGRAPAGGICEPQHQPLPVHRRRVRLADRGRGTRGNQADRHVAGLRRTAGRRCSDRQRG